MKSIRINLVLAVDFSKGDGSDLTEEEVAQLRRNVDFIPQATASEGGFIAFAEECVVDRFDYQVSIPRVIA